MANLSLYGVPISRATSAGGGGPISVIQDGVKPAAGTSGGANQWDGFVGGAGGASGDWCGLEMFGTVSFTSVVFQEGGAFGDGGWYTSTPTIQVRQSGVWNNVTNQNCSPSYNANNTLSFETYTFTFDAIQGDAIRIFGTPGGAEAFMSCGEFEAYGDLISMADVTSLATATSDTTPTGSGGAISVIKDGVLCTNAADCFDTYDGGSADSDDWIAYTFAQNYEFRALMFFLGAVQAGGGTFVSTPPVEVRVGGVWTAVSSQALKTQGAQKGGAVGTSFVTTLNTDEINRAYAFTFTPITGDGIRLRGDPGGTQNFITCAEMRAIVTASGGITASLATTATVTGTAGGGGAVASTPSTTASVTGALGHTPSAAPSTTASVSGSLQGRSALASSPSTTASVSGAIGGATTLASSPSTTASLSGGLSAQGAIAAAPSTTATIAGTFDVTQDNLAASLSSTATVAATPGAIVNISASLSTTAGLRLNNGNSDDYYPSPDVDEVVKSPSPEDYVLDPDEPEYVNDPPDGR